MNARGLAGVALVMAAFLVIGGCDNSPPSRAAVQRSVYAPKLVSQAGGRLLLSLGAAQVPEMTLTAVKEVELPGVLDTTGQIAFDQQNLAQIVSRVAGRIEATRVVLWDVVRRGEPIVQLYSPDLMTAEAEYLEALNTRRISPATAGGLADTMVLAAQRKLELLGMSAADVAAIRTPAPTAWIRAPISGTVLSNNAKIGAAVNPGDVLYTLGTLNDVWITADIYEDDLPRIHPGQQMEATTTAYPGEVFRGVVTRISPDIDPATHTLKLRCQIRNPGGKLKPAMLARVRIITRLGAALVVPQEALVFDTDAYYVFVVRGGGLFERRKVRIGSWREQGFTRVLDGLEPGEQVVASESIQLNQLWHQAGGTS